MATNQNILQLPQQTGTADSSSVFYAVKGGTTDTGLPLSVLFNSPVFTGMPVVPNYAPLAGATFTGQVNYSFTNASIVLNDTSGSGGSTLYFNAAGSTQFDITVNNSAGNLNVNRFSGGTFAATEISIAGTGGTTLTRLAVTGLITPTSTVGIKGTATNDNTQAGSVGEYITGTTGLVSLTTSTPFNAASVSLTAGDWDVVGTVSFVPAGSTTVSIVQTGISTTSATFPAANTGGYVLSTAPFTTGGLQIQNSPVVRLSLASTTTVYLVGQLGFGTSTAQGEGFIRARRVR